MNKLIVTLLLIIILLGGGGAAYFFLFAGDKAEETETSTEDVWNPYSTAEMHLVTLNDFMISAAKGEYVVKMTVTLELNGEEAMKRYEGLESADAEAAEAGGHGSSGEGALTPMQVTLNSIIGTFMFEASEETLKDKEKMEHEMATYINKKLGFKEEIVHHVLVENYIIQ